MNQEIKDITEGNVVWHTADTPNGLNTSLHCYYNRERFSDIGHYTGESHIGSSALCNKNYGISEDASSFIPIEQLHPSPLNRNAACKKCLKIYDTLKTNNNEQSI